MRSKTSSNLFVGFAAALLAFIRILLPMISLINNNFTHFFQ